MTPPRLLRWIVKRQLAHQDREFLLADLDDEFEARRRAGKRAAGWYLAQGLHAGWTRRTPRAPRGSMTMGFWQEVRYATRNLWKQRSFTTVALLTLSLGIGANTAVFSVISHVLMAPLPYRDADR